MMTGFERYTKKTRRAAFLEEKEQVVPWSELCALKLHTVDEKPELRRPSTIEARRVNPRSNATVGLPSKGGKVKDRQQTKRKVNRAVGRQASSRTMD